MVYYHAWLLIVLKIQVKNKHNLHNLIRRASEREPIEDPIEGKKVYLSSYRGDERVGMKNRDDGRPFPTPRLSR